MHPVLYMLSQLDVICYWSIVYTSRHISTSKMLNIQVACEIGLLGRHRVATVGL
jgi:hypothetical protein